VLGLILQTMNTGQQSKQMTVFNNVVNSYIERVQAMPFDNVVVGTETGQLASSETTTVGAFTVVITPSVTPGATSALKTLTVNATITGYGDTQSISTTVVIRDKSDFITQGVSGPEVNWLTTNMPDENEIVWANYKDSGGLLKIEAEAIAVEGQTITKVTISADNGRILESDTGDIASWVIPAEEQEQTWTLTGFNWNTEQTGIIDAETGEIGPVIPDGLRTIKIRVEDSGGGFAERTYVLLVDNMAPMAPQDLQMQIVTSGPIASWTTPLDGTTLPPSCTAGLNKQTGTTWARSATTGISTNQIALSPFSRYVVDVTAVGVAPVSGAYEPRLSPTTTMPQSVITPPLASGTWVVSSSGSHKTYLVSLSVPEPDFAVIGTPVYKWYSSTSPSGPWTTVFALTRTVTGQSYGGSVLYFRCFVTLTPGTEPTGSAGTAVTVGSSVLGPTSTSGSGTLAGQWLP
jgi:hypothetical protein